MESSPRPRNIAMLPKGQSLTQSAEPDPGPSFVSTSRKRMRAESYVQGVKGGNGNIQDGSIRRRQRRRLSCESCRRAKCRCEYNHQAQACHRCHTLRLSCSLGLNDHAVHASRPDSGLVPNTDQRILQLEKVLHDVESTLQALQTHRPPVMTASEPLGPASITRVHNRSTAPGPATRVENIRLGNLNSTDEGVNLSPADEGINSPAVILRQIDSQLTGYRRMFDDVNTDLSNLQLLSGDAADRLIALFTRHRRHTLLVNDVADIVSGRNLRESSPFLHAVCCLNGFRYSKDEPVGSALHRELYEHVRRALGQVLLASPLPIPELYAVLIMCLFGSAPTKGPEYIDSWVLSGHCAQQAMLAINFSALATKIKSAQTTLTDQRGIRLWSNICLCHLHWAAITGRPPIIPIQYLQQCNILLDFYEASMLDSLLIAEIRLYVIFHQKISQPNDGDINELLIWKEKWKHLFDLPTSSILKISHHAAHLILARRRIESIRHLPQIGEDACPGAATDIRLETERSINLKTLQHSVYKSAISIIQIFVEMSHQLSEELPEFYYICIAYSVLIIQQYHQSADSSDTGTLGLLYLLQTRYSSFDMIPSAMRFATDRAIDKLESCGGAFAGRHSISSQRRDDNSQHSPLPKPAQIKPLDRESLDFDDYPQATGIGSFQFGLGYSLLEGFSQCGFPDFAPFDSLNL